MVSNNKNQQIEKLANQQSQLRTCLKQSTLKLHLLLRIRIQLTGERLDLGNVGLVVARGARQDLPDSRLVALGGELLHLGVHALLDLLIF